MPEHPSDRVWSISAEKIPVGHSAKFPILWRGRTVQAFVINWKGRYYAYVNHCAHAGTPLDWWPNEFLSEDGRFLKCGTHGSLYDPTTGNCTGGPCAGGTLLSLQVELLDGRIVVSSS